MDLNLIVSNRRNPSGPLVHFIREKARKYTPHQRRGVRKGDPIDFPENKFAATLLCLTNMAPKQIAQAVGASYGVLRLWKTEPRFKELVKAHRNEYIRYFANLITVTGILDPEKLLNEIEKDAIPHSLVILDLLDEFGEIVRKNPATIALLIEIEGRFKISEAASSRNRRDLMKSVADLWAKKFSFLTFIHNGLIDEGIKVLSKSNPDRKEKRRAIEALEATKVFELKKSGEFLSYLQEVV
jgi:hypothetical protein